MTLPRPGDLILDRYFPDANEEERDRARAALREWAALLIRIGERLRLASGDGLDSPELPRRHTMIEASPKPIPDN